MYNHSDSYPEFLGEIVVNWLAERSTERLKEIFDNLEMVPEENLTAIDRRWCEEHGIEPGTNWYDTLRDNQGDLDSLETCPIAIDGSSFIYDSLFCKYAYIANLDTNELEFWLGFQKKPDPSNRYGAKCDCGGYYPCKLVKTWSFDDDVWENPSEIVNEMTTIANKEEEDSA